MKSLTQKIEETQQKKKVADVRSGDTVRVHQKIKEGNKERVQVFEGLVIRTKRRNSLTSSIVVRRLASGVGVEKSFLLHSPLVERVEVVKRSDVNRNYLTYMRDRAGKSARLDSVEFDRDKANEQEFGSDEEEQEAEEAEAPAEEAKTEQKAEEKTEDKAEDEAEAADDGKDAKADAEETDEKASE